MIILDETIPPNGQEDERFGLLLYALTDYGIKRELQHVASVAVLTDKVAEANAKMTSVSSAVNDALDTHIATKGPIHGETKETIGLGLVDNLRTATLEEHVDGSDDLFCTPAGVKYAAQFLVEPDYTGFIPQTVLPIAYFKRLTGDLSINSISFSPWTQSNKKGNLYITDGAYYVSLLSKNGGGVNYLSDLLTSRDLMYFTPSGGTTAPKLAYGWNAKTGYQALSDGSKQLTFFDYAHNGTGGEFALNFSGSVTGDYLSTLFDPLLDTSSLIGGLRLTQAGLNVTLTTITQPDESVATLLVDNTTGFSFNATGPKGTVRTGTINNLIPLADFITVTDATAVTIDPTYTAIDQTHGYGNMEWEVKGKSAILYTDAILRTTFQGVVKKIVARIALRLTISGSTYTIAPLSQVSMATITAGGIAVSGNILFEEEIDSALHPVYGKGPFLSEGGHATSMASNQSFFLRAFTHDLTSLVDLAKNYHETLSLSGEYTKEYPGSFAAPIGVNIKRFIPFNSTASGLKVLTYPMANTSEDYYGVLSWDSPQILQSSKNKPLYYRFKQASSLTNFTLSSTIPARLIVNSGADGSVTVRGLSFLRSDYTAGTGKLVITENEVKASETWALDADSITTMESILSTFSTRSHTAYTSAGVAYDASKQSMSWSVGILTTSDDITAVTRCVVLLSDGCGYVGCQIVPTTPNSGTRTFTINRASLGTLTSMTFGMAAVPDFSAAEYLTPPAYNDIMVLTRSDNSLEIAFNNAFKTKYGMVSFLYSGTTLTLDKIENPRVSVGNFPIIGKRGCCPISIPYYGIFRMTDNEEEFFNANLNRYLNQYGDLTDDVVTMGGSDYHLIRIPAGTKVFLDGREFQMISGLVVYAQVGVTSYIYLTAAADNVMAEARTVKSEPAVDEIIYAVMDEAGNLVINDTYTVIDGFAVSYTRQGSSIPYTTGYPMDLGETLFFKTTFGDPDLDVIMNSTMPEFGGMEYMPDLDEEINDIIPSWDNLEDQAMDLMMNQILPEDIGTLEENIDECINEIQPEYVEDYRDSNDIIVNQLMPEIGMSRFVLTDYIVNQILPDSE